MLAGLETGISSTSIRTLTRTHYQISRTQWTCHMNSSCVGQVMGWLLLVCGSQNALLWAGSWVSWDPATSSSEGGVQLDEIFYPRQYQTFPAGWLDLAPHNASLPYHVAFEFPTQIPHGTCPVLLTLPCDNGERVLRVREREQVLKVGRGWSGKHGVDWEEFLTKWTPKVKAKNEKFPALWKDSHFTIFYCWSPIGMFIY